MRRSVVALIPAIEAGGEPEDRAGYRVPRRSSSVPTAVSPLARCRGRREVPRAFTPRSSTNSADAASSSAEQGGGLTRCWPSGGGGTRSGAAPGSASCCKDSRSRRLPIHDRLSKPRGCYSAKVRTFIDLVTKIGIRPLANLAA